MKSINIQFVPYSQMRFTTAGDWKIEGDILNIWIVNSLEWRYSMIVLMHELTEILLCLHEGVTTEMADTFDSLWEKEVEEGKHDPKEEAGFDRECPYRRGHVWGARMERLFCFLLGVNWKTYCSFWDDFFSKV